MTRELQTQVFLVVCLCTVTAIFFVPYLLSGRRLIQPTPQDGQSENSHTSLLSSIPGFPNTSTSSLASTAGPTNSPTSAPPTARPSHGTQGYMLALTYSDQITSAVDNIRSLMCLTKKIGGVQVVEPFVTGSLLGLNLTANWTREVKMTDIFDYGAWKRSTPFKKYGERVSFKTFLQNAPHKLLMVQYCHASFCYPCKHKDIVTRSRIFCELNGFELVGILCTKRNSAFHQSTLFSTQTTAKLIW